MVETVKLETTKHKFCVLEWFEIFMKLCFDKGE